MFLLKYFTMNAVVQTLHFMINVFFMGAKYFIMETHYYGTIKPLCLHF